jgi:hypothetical protein
MPAAIAAVAFSPPFVPMLGAGPIAGVLLIPKFAMGVPQSYANFGNRTPGAAMRMVKILVVLIVAGGALASTAARAGDDVDLLLVLAADVSRSVDATKFQLQRDGYAAAVSNPRVLEAIHSGHYGRIGVTFVEWSGASAQRVVIDWSEIGDAASAKQFGDQLIESPRSFAGRTSISGGIEFALARLAAAPFNCIRRTIDVSGDGTNNDGRAVAELRDQAVAKGVTINGLVILSDNPMPWNPEHTNPPGGLDNYYRNNVVGGPGAFVMVAKNFDSFGQAIVAKLIAEVSQADGAKPWQAVSR